MKSLKIPNGACICQYVDFGTREILIEISVRKQL
jgi:hypothetical protein